MLAYDWDQLFKAGIATSSQQQRDPEQDPSGASQRMYIIKPIDGQLHYLRRGKNVRQGESEAIQEAGFDLQSIAFNVSSKAPFPAGIRHMAHVGAGSRPCVCLISKHTCWPCILICCLLCHSLVISRREVF